MTLKLVALGNRQRMGKDTVANFMADCLRKQGKTVQVIGFADELKDRAYQLFGHLGLQPKEYYEQFPDARTIPLPCGKTPRQIWIEFGNKMREIDPNIWVALADKSIWAEYVFVKDLRFANEAGWVQEKRGCSVNVYRPGIEMFNDGADDQLVGRWWDHQIVNDSTLDVLEHKSIILLHHVQSMKGWL